jgi:LPXTG-motif cell wall-anchored protein
LFFSSNRRTSPRRFGALVFSGALVASFAGIALATPASAAHGEGAPYDTNMACADLDPTWEEFKLEVNPSGDTVAYEVGDSTHDVKSGFVISITDATAYTFNWSSTGDFEVMTVLVKGGAGGGGVRYAYPEGATEGEDLHAASLGGVDATGLYHEISHVSFCFTAVDEPETPETPETPLTPETPETPVVVEPAIAPPAPAVAGDTIVLGETLVRGDTLPRTGAAATNTLALAGGLGLASGLMMLMLARRKTAVHSG